MPDSALPLSVSGWLLRGAIREDDLGFLLGGPYGGDPHDDPYGPIWRVMHHFYDPVHDSPLIVSSFCRALFETATGETADFHRSPDWASGARDAFNDPDTPRADRRNHFTLFDAREAMYRALTGKNADGADVAPTEEARNRYWATLFRALGDVVHHLQDMAQPQHTRNDAHADAPCFGDNSVFEEYIEARATRANFFHIDGARLEPLEDLGYEGYPIPRFTKYSDFWSTSPGAGSATGDGLADYSNRGFFTAGTNLGSNNYPLPSNDAGTYAPESAEGLLSGWPLQRIAFLRGDVPDNKAGPSNVRMTTESIFDFFLLNTPPTHSLNRYNYDDHASLLIPRAVAYSAGVIDYFFRGRLKIQDAGYTDDGIVLRVKNAIDPNEQDYWKDETLGAGGRMVVTLRYALPAPPDGTTQHQHTSSVALLEETLPPGRASWGVFTFNDLPPPPQEATDVEYRLVYRGPIGQEADAIAVGTFKPVSGFLVTPGYAPADGLSEAGEPRLIYRAGGEWRLDKDPSFVAGNIDWKGWYRNGRPTKVLSWVGARARYVPDSEVCVLTNNRCRWISSSAMDDVIYEGGSVFAVAPGSVLGAAVARDAEGRDWLVAIVKQGSADVVYRRPYKRGGTAAFYDEATNPNGWQEIGRYNARASDRPGMEISHEADIPWFFRGDGREAQTMRRWWDISDGGVGQRLKRLKLTIDASVETATIDDLGNFSGTRSRSCTESYDSDGAGGAQAVSQSAGRYVIAVDYKQNIEQLAIVDWQGSSENASQVSVTKTTDPDTGKSRVVARSGSHTHQSSRLERLLWGAAEITVFADTDHFDAAWTFGAPGSSYSWDSGTDFEEQEIVYYLDLRHDLLSFYEWGWNESESFREDEGVLTQVAGEGEFEEAQVIVSGTGVEGEALTPLTRNFTYTFDPSSGSRIFELHCVPADNLPPSPDFSHNFGWFWESLVGGWAVDVLGAVMFSQKVYSDGGYQPEAPASYLTGGDLTETIPGAPGPEAVYFPIKLVR